MTFPCVMKVIKGISAFLCISLHFSSFLYISLDLSTFHCISLHFSAFLCISLNLWISLHFSTFFCISLHFTFYISRQFDGAYRRPMDAIFTPCASFNIERRGAKMAYCANYKVHKPFSFLHQRGNHPFSPFTINGMTEYDHTSCKTLREWFLHLKPVTNSIIYILYVHLVSKSQKLKVIWHLFVCRFLEVSSFQWIL